LTAKLPLSNTALHTVGNVTSVTTGQDWVHYAWSSGLVYGGGIVDNGNGSVTLANAEVMLRSADTDHANLAVYFVPGATLTLTNNDVNYVHADYNGGSPIFTTSTAPDDINGHTQTMLYVLSRRDSEIVGIDATSQNVDVGTKVDDLLVLSDGYKYGPFTHATGGSRIGNGTATYITLTEGKFYYGLTPVAHPSFDTSIAGTNSNNVFRYYYNRSAWTYTADSKTISNTQYDNAGTLTALSNNRYRTDYVYLVPDGILGNSYLVVVYGNTQFQTSAEAAVAPVPSSLPSEIDGLAILVGQVIAQQGSNTITVASFRTDFAVSPVTNHNALAGLQGGTTGQYYHLTSMAATSLNAISDTLPTNGALLIGNSSAFNLSTLTAGENIAITNGNGTISIAATVGVVAMGIGNASDNLIFSNTQVNFAASGGTTVDINAASRTVTYSSVDTTNATNISSGTLANTRLSGTYGIDISGTANNSTYAYGKTEGNLNVNSALVANNATYAFGKSEANLNVNSASQASNATNLNSQPGSYYTNASNITTGTLPEAQLSANVLLTTSTTGINASAISTGTVPAARLASANTTVNGVVDTTTQSFAGSKTFTGVLTANAGSKLVIQNGVDGTSTRGIFFWTETDPNWGMYLSQAGASKSLANGVAASSIDSRSGWHVRSRSGSLNSEGFLWENQGEVALMSLTGDTGDLYLKGNAYVGNSTSQVVIHSGSTTGINASALSTGTVPDARLSGTYTNITANNATYAFGKTEGNLNVNNATTAGTANNATYAFGKSEGNLNVNSAVSANNSTYAYGKSEGNLNVNSAVTANNSTYAFGKSEGDLNVNSATSAGTANNSTYAFGKSEGNLNVNSAVFVSGNTVTTNSTVLAVGANVIANTSALLIGNSSVNVVTNSSQISIGAGTLTATAYSGTANNATYAFGKTEGNLNVNSAVTANNATYAYGKTEGNLNVNNATTAGTANNATYAFGKTEGDLNVNNATYAYGKTEGNLNVNSAVFLSGNTVTTNSTVLAVGANVVANTSALLVGNSSVNVVTNSSQISIGSGTLTATAYSGTANNATYAFGKTEGNLNVNNATTAGTANNATYAFGKTEGDLNVNSAINANNTTYAFGKLEGALNVNSASYLGAKTEGNLNVNSAVFLSSNTVQTNTTVLSVGSNVAVNTSSYFVGNSTQNSIHTSVSLITGNSTVNTVVNTTTMAVGANVYLNATAHFVGNSSVNTVITAGSITISGTPVTAVSLDPIVAAIALG